MNLVECGLIPGRNGGNERAIQIVSGDRLQHWRAARSNPGASRTNWRVRGQLGLAHSGT
jgi:hypothetical protein